MKIDHVAIAVKDFEKAFEFYKEIFQAKSEIHIDEKRGIKVAIFYLDNINIELIAPIRENSEISNFIDKRGGGIHHLAIKVKEIEKYKKFKMLNDIQEGITSKKVAFLDPREYFKVLIEIIE